MKKFNFFLNFLHKMQNNIFLTYNKGLKLFSNYDKKYLAKLFNSLKNLFMDIFPQQNFYITFIIKLVIKTF